MDIQTKRVYETATPRDGFRVLVDRVWPRGMSAERLHADLWLKEVAPSAPLRQWFAHERSKWTEFKRRYFAELEGKPELIKRLLGHAAKGRLTLLFSARDAGHNQAVALREYLLSRARKRLAARPPSAAARRRRR
jgi:uncharacterized protein YeaO (DUF488 family)